MVGWKMVIYRKRLCRRIMNGVTERGSPRKRWSQDVEKNIKAIGERNWK